MAKGIKKIKVTSGLYYPKMSVLGQRITIKPDQWVYFGVEEWLPGTTDADKKKPLTWMRQDSNRQNIVNQVTSATGYKFLIDKQYCGSYHFYIEASLSGVRDKKNNTGIFVRGWCEPKIVSSKWSTQKNSKSIKNNKKVDYISYGHIVHLNLMTEGLNGNTVIIELWNQQYAKKDKLVHVYNNVQVIDGEVNLKIENTFAWMAYVDNIQNVEEFYVKVKDVASKQYIKDKLGDDLHAIYLNVKNKIATTNTNGAQNQTPTKVYKPDVNSVRLEPCKFEVIKITENETKDGKASNTTVKVFDNGNGVKLIKSAALQEHIQRTIYYKFDSTVIDKDGEAVLNNVLKFLLEHKDSTMNLSGYACVIGKENYNKGLSQRRADVVKKFFADGGLDPRRIISVGKGEVDPTDDKMGRDNIRYKNEKDYENNRRVDISFIFNAHDAQTVNYEVTAPSVSMKKDITIDVTGFQTNECFRDSKGKHKKQTLIVDVGQAIDKGDTVKTFTTPSFNYGVYSDLSQFDAFPIQYIWPMWATPNQFHLHAHTCRYFSNEKRTTILIKAYPDIKWTLTFFVNLTNELSVKWQNQPAAKHKDLQAKAGKIGAERRWKQKDASFGFSLKSEWEKNRSGSFQKSKEVKGEYETKFKKLYDLFGSMGAMSDGITNKTKGQVRNIGFKGLPVTFAIKPPNINLKGEWCLERAKQKNTEIERLGTKVDISFNAEPLIGLEVTVDLLCTAVGLVAGALSGGTAAPGAVRLYGVIKDHMNTGVEFGNDDFGAKMSSDVYIDLVISSEIKTSIGFSFNTVSEKSDKQGKIEAKNTLKIELKAGVWAKAEANLVIVKVEGYFEMSGKGSASITFGHGVKFDDKGLNYRPELGFDGLNAEYVIKGKVGMSAKKKIPRGGNKKPAELKGSSEDEGIIAEGKFNEIVPKFDVIKSLEELFGFSADIPLIRN
ncbi:OmpA family protein [Chryseobacterium sp.]|uniref:OmpA family protein n=1 Tax=Chryseobacterium sp. TaxID=1871047 RepID=UPI001B294888|nr:OmpA family protein [Chryseobacterium sp.]MBO9690068.1 OmpA family protein [Chryseobacterium sp.]